MPQNPIRRFSCTEMVCASAKKAKPRQHEPLYWVPRVTRTQRSCIDMKLRRHKVETSVPSEQGLLPGLRFRPQSRPCGAMTKLLPKFLSTIGKRIRWPWPSRTGTTRCASIGALLFSVPHFVRGVSLRLLQPDAHSPRRCPTRHRL
jgi:hypothetical protein